MKQQLSQPYKALTGGNKRRANLKATLLAGSAIAVLTGGALGLYAALNSSSDAPKSTTNSTAKNQTINQPKSDAVQIKNNIIVTQTYAELGQFIGDPAGNALYTYGKDTTGVSNCAADCLTSWPAYKAPTATADLPKNITIINRADGTLQYAYKGQPLYYFTGDSNGMVTGDGLNNFHVAKP